jgi:hypothetical protein
MPPGAPKWLNAPTVVGRCRKFSSAQTRYPRVLDDLYSLDEAGKLDPAG